MSVISSASATLRTIDDLHGPAGKLEALLNPGTEDAPYVALVCHPHPLGGGTMHNKVVYHAMKALQSLGLPVLRFNFRGTGLSEGTHDGHAETGDVQAALDWLKREFDRPILFTGFSFGAAIGLRACCGDERVQGLTALGLPVHAEGRDYQYGFLASCPQPKIFISGTRDQYGPREQLAAVFHTVKQPAEMIWIQDADHFFAGKLDQVQFAIRSWVQTHFLPARVS